MVRRDAASLPGHLLQGNGTAAGALHGNHDPVGTFRQQLSSFRPELGRKKPVTSGRGSATLNMAQDGDPSQATELLGCARPLRRVGHLRAIVNAR